MEYSTDNMKVGIITEPAMRNNINQGNALQTFALNYYLRTRYPDDIIETLFFGIGQLSKLKVTMSIETIKKVINRVHREKPQEENSIRETLLRERKNRVTGFVLQNVTLSPEHYDFESLCKSDYDLFVVGSDVVWGQLPHGVNRIKFLDFENSHHAGRVSYAASFGRDWIPRQNIAVVKRFIKRFDYISVRENSSVKMLNNLSINRVEHVVDPVLLLNRDDWTKREEKPVEIEFDLNSERYVFAYLLGDNNNQRLQISKYAQSEKMRLVTVPFITGIYNDYDELFGEINVMDCSPENFLWLIHHADMVFTDSFHCLVFSTIYERKFMTLKRTWVQDINNRLVDYLATIGQLDKFADSLHYDAINLKEWNYDSINTKLDDLIEKSQLYINKFMDDFHHRFVTTE